MDICEKLHNILDAYPSGALWVRDIWWNPPYHPWPCNERIPAPGGWLRMQWLPTLDGWKCPASAIEMKNDCTMVRLMQSRVIRARSSYPHDPTFASAEKACMWTSPKINQTADADCQFLCNRNSCIPFSVTHISFSHDPCSFIKKICLLKKNFLKNTENFFM